jgi:uncharacterized membrane protein YfcA
MSSFWAISCGSTGRGVWKTGRSIPIFFIFQPALIFNQQTGLMNVNDIIVLALIGLSAGIVSGMLGIGGAIIIVPALVFFFGMTQHQAQGTSLAILLFPVGFLAFWNYYKQGTVNFKFAIVVMLAFFIGGYLGSLFAAHMQERILRIVFGILIIVLGFRMILFK